VGAKQATAPLPVSHAGFCLNFYIVKFSQCDKDTGMVFRAQPPREITAAPDAPRLGPFSFGHSLGQIKATYSYYLGRQSRV
jgi:hypothetical protein